MTTTTITLTDDQRQRLTCPNVESLPSPMPPTWTDEELATAEQQLAYWRSTAEAALQVVAQLSEAIHANREAREERKI